MIKLVLPPVLAALPGMIVISPSSAADLFHIDFEEYTPGPLSEGGPGQSETYQWKQTGEAATVQEKLSNRGKRALELGGPRVEARRRFDGGEGVEPLTSRVQYYDFRVYPRCSNNEYCVVVRMFDHPSGHAFMDVHFKSDGAIAVMKAGKSASDPGEVVDTGHKWRRKRWLRIVLVMDRETQEFDLYLDRKKSPAGPFTFAHRFDQLESLAFEGPHADDPNAFFYYDDLRWTDVNPLTESE